MWISFWGASMRFVIYLLYLVAYVLQNEEMYNLEWLSAPPAFIFHLPHFAHFSEIATPYSRPLAENWTFLFET